MRCYPVWLLRDCECWWASGLSYVTFVYRMMRRVKYATATLYHSLSPSYIHLQTYALASTRFFTLDKGFFWAIWSRPIQHSSQYVEACSNMTHKEVMKRDSPKNDSFCSSERSESRELTQAVVATTLRGSRTTVLPSADTLVSAPFTYPKIHFWYVIFHK